MTTPEPSQRTIARSVAVEVETSCADGGEPCEGPNHAPFRRGAAGRVLAASLQHPLGVLLPSSLLNTSQQFLSIWPRQLLGFCLRTRNFSFAPGDPSSLPALGALLVQLAIANLAVRYQVRLARLCFIRAVRHDCERRLPILITRYRGYVCKRPSWQGWLRVIVAILGFIRTAASAQISYSGTKG